MNVTIEDVDDNPPVFTSCRNVRFTICHVTAYSATVDRYFQVSLDIVYNAGKKLHASFSMIFNIRANLF